MTATTTNRWTRISEAIPELSAQVKSRRIGIYRLGRRYTVHLSNGGPRQLMCGAGNGWGTFDSMAHGDRNPAQGDVCRSCLRIWERQQV